MPDLITITETLRRADSLDDFRGSTGKAVRNMPWYRLLDDGTLVFDFIGKHTDPKELGALIDQGVVYVRVDNSKIISK